MEKIKKGITMKIILSLAASVLLFTGCPSDKAKTVAAVPESAPALSPPFVVGAGPMATPNPQWYIGRDGTVYPWKLDGKTNGYDERTEIPIPVPKPIPNLGFYMTTNEAYRLDPATKAWLASLTEPPEIDFYSGLIKK